MTIHITAETALDALDKAVEQRGADFVYTAGPRAIYEETCFYTNEDGTPSCIVALALNILGVDHTKLIEDVTVAGGALEKVMAEKDMTATPEALTVLNTAQMHQDDHRPYGEAVAAAHRYYQTIRDEH